MSWLVAVCLCVGGSEGLATALNALAALIVTYGPPIPRWVLQVLPLPAAHALVKAQKRLANAAQDVGGGQLLPLTQPGLDGPTPSVPLVYPASGGGQGAGLHKTALPSAHSH